MKVEELFTVKVTWPKPRVRDNGLWNLTTNKRLREAIEKCLATGETVYSESVGEALYCVRPRFPLIDEAMARPENKSFLKVTVSVYSQAFNAGVRE